MSTAQPVASTALSSSAGIASPGGEDHGRDTSARARRKRRRLAESGGPFFLVGSNQAAEPATSDAQDDGKLAPPHPAGRYDRLRLLQGSPLPASSWVRASGPPPSTSTAIARQKASMNRRRCAARAFTTWPALPPQEGLHGATAPAADHVLSGLPTSSSWTFSLRVAPFHQGRSVPVSFPAIPRRVSQLDRAAQGQHHHRRRGRRVSPYSPGPGAIVGGLRCGGTARSSVRRCGRSKLCFISSAIFEAFAVPPALSARVMLLARRLRPPMTRACGGDLRVSPGAG